jgi:putative ABC transport system permease protein
VIDANTAESEGFELGDTVTLAGRGGTGEYTLVGIGSLGGVDSFGGASFAVLALPEAQRMTGKEGQFDQISVAAEEGVSPDELVRELSLDLPTGVTVETGQQNVQSQRDDIAELVGFLTTALLIFAGVALFVAAFLIFNTFSIIVAQRTREFGMLRALGANRRQIVFSVVLEALVLGLLASALGLGLGILFASVLEAAFKGLGIDLPASGRVIEARTVVVAIVAGTALTLVAALAPAIRATRVAPIAALREGVSLESPTASRRRAIFAVVLTILGIAALVLALAEAISPAGLWVGIGAAVTFLGAALLSPELVRPIASLVGRPLERLRGVPGRLARENSVRNPGRTAATAAALMIGLALVSFVTVFAAGLRGSIDDAIDEVFASDLIIAHRDGFSDIPARSGDAVAGIDGVEIVSPYRFTDALIDGSREDRTLSLVNPATVARVLELDWVEGSAAVLAGLGPNDAAMDSKQAEERGLGVGDSFTATTPSGERIDYTVRGTYEDNADFTGDFVASDANADAYGEGSSVTNFFVDLGPGADAAAVREELEGELDTAFPTIEVQDQEELKDSIAEELNGLLAAVYALLALAIIVSLFGIVNTLALSIYERTRELGLLRAVGMSRRQVRRVIRYEAVITALIGAVLGLVLGVVFAVIASRPLADEGFTLEIPYVALVILLVLAVIAGILAAIAPARRASRLNVLDALAYE